MIILVICCLYVILGPTDDIQSVSYIGACTYPPVNCYMYLYTKLGGQSEKIGCFVYVHALECWAIRYILSACKMKLLNHSIAFLACQHFSCLLIGRQEPGKNAYSSHYHHL